MPRNEGKLQPNSIILFKQQKTHRSNSHQSKSNSRIKDLIKLNTFESTTRLTPCDFTMKNTTYSKVCNMEDPQRRIKRDHSPLYKKSSQQADLFQKGLKKIGNNVHLQSKVKISDKIIKQDTSMRQLSRNKSTGKLDPNKQKYDIFKLDESLPTQIQTSRSIRKANPNVQSSHIKQQKAGKKGVQYKNIQTQQTADYVIKALTTHVSNSTKQIHLKFVKKQNILKANNEQKVNETKIAHKRHYSNLISANKVNLQIKSNGICLKQQVNQNDKQNINFTHDYYKNDSRMGLNKNNKIFQNDKQNYTKPTPKISTHVENTRFGELRKKFL